MNVGPIKPPKTPDSISAKAKLSRMSKKQLIAVIHQQLAFLKHTAYISSSAAGHFIDDKKLGTLSHKELEKKVASLQKDLISETVRWEYGPAINRYRVAQKMVDAEVKKIIGEAPEKEKQIVEKIKEVQAQEIAWLDENCKRLFEDRGFRELAAEYKIEGDSSYVFLNRVALALGRYDKLKNEFPKLREEHREFKKKYFEYREEWDKFIGQLNALCLKKARAGQKVEMAIKKVLKMEDYSGEPIDVKNEEEGGIILSSPTLGIRSLHKKGIDGKGVTVVVVDSGIYPHQDFDDRLVAFKDFVGFSDEPCDNMGHGTLVAGIIAGSGKISGGRYKGVAPAARVIGIRVFDEKLATSEKINGKDKDFEAFYEAANWILENKEKYNIKVVNWGVASSTSEPNDEYKNLFIDELIKKGITVIAPVGNAGPQLGSISYPANYKGIIAVGNLDQSFTASVQDDIVATDSSRGALQKENIKPDVVAPGSSIISALTPQTFIGEEYTKIDFNNDFKNDYVMATGSSMASPFVAGVVALMYQVNPDLTPEEVSNILRGTADKLPGISKEAQGSGIIDPQRAVEAARSLKKK